MSLVSITGRVHSKENFILLRKHSNSLFVSLWQRSTSKGKTNEAEEIRKPAGTFYMQRERARRLWAGLAVGSIDWPRAGTYRAWEQGQWTSQQETGMIKHLQVLHEAVLWMEEDVQGINKMDLEEKILMDDLLTLDVADVFCCFGLKFSGPGPHKLDWPKNFKPKFSQELHPHEPPSHESSPYISWGNIGTIPFCLMFYPGLTVCCVKEAMLGNFWKPLPCKCDPQESHDLEGRRKGAAIFIIRSLIRAPEPWWTLTGVAT